MADSDRLGVISHLFFVFIYFFKTVAAAPRRDAAVRSHQAPAF